VRARRLILLVLIVVVAASLPLLILSAWRPEGAATGEGTSALVDGPANAVEWLGVVFAWAACLLLLATFLRRKRPQESTEEAVWEEE
jgi:hypothetical protein